MKTAVMLLIGNFILMLLGATLPDQMGYLDRISRTIQSRSGRKLFHTLELILLPPVCLSALSWVITSILLALLVAAIIGALESIDRLRRNVSKSCQKETFESILGDLSEGLTLRSRRNGVCVAKIWYLRQVLCSVDLMFSYSFGWAVLQSGPTSR
jgi:hypothetical protein